MRTSTRAADGMDGDVVERTTESISWMFAHQDEAIISSLVRVKNEGGKNGMTATTGDGGNEDDEEWRRWLSRADLREWESTINEVRTVRFITSTCERSLTTPPRPLARPRLEDEVVAQRRP